MIRIFIAEEIPSLNKGEAAILFGMLESFRNIEKDVEVDLLSLYPEIDRSRYLDKVNVIDEINDLHLSSGYNRFLIIRLFDSIFVLPQYISFVVLYKIFKLNVLKIMKKEIWNRYFASDLIIIGHDGTFGGMFGLVYFSQVYNLFVAKILKKPIVIYGASIEPFEGMLRFLIAKFVLNHVNLITLRDEKSYEYLKNIGVDLSHMHLTADMAYLLPASPTKRANEIMSQENIDKDHRPLIGITVTREICCLAFSNVGDLEERYLKSIRLFSQVVDYIAVKLNAVIIFIPQCIGPGENLDDRFVARDIYQLIENKNKVKLIEKEYRPEELKSLVSQFDLFIGERLHSVVGAISMCVPSIAILYPAPRNEILKGVLDEKWICNIEMADLNTLVSKIDEIWEMKGELKKDLADKVKIVKRQALLNGELLKNLLGGNRNEDSNNLP